jgi:hypothetical protein
MAAEYASVDLKENLLLTISEYGLGKLLTVTSNPEHSERLFSITSYPSQPSDFRVVHSAQIRQDPKAIVIRAKFAKFQGTHDVFMVAQLNGCLSIYTY